MCSLPLTFFVSATFIYWLSVSVSVHVKVDEEISVSRHLDSQQSHYAEF